MKAIKPEHFLAAQIANPVHRVRPASTDYMSRGPEEDARRIKAAEEKRRKRALRNRLNQTGDQ